MSRSLLHAISSLAKYEKPKAPLATQYLAILCRHRLPSRSRAFIKAADRFIGYLFTYGHDVSIANRYFQPTFYNNKKQYVSFKWDYVNQYLFCSGCSYIDDCKFNRFSSLCPRFRIAWAIEHVTTLTNRILVSDPRNKPARVCRRRRVTHG